ncbi:glucosamine inositolphosphorylceramide transferase family protein [Pseudoalteromonas ulvae]|uniref:Glucosamine inositolphosphorylceramide transferase 1 N-terminal domain-containing protein n=1 Tax=Pseudoalteromonas ulvae TaxID=107327 RepID=A0A244CUR4_PSEDV|nr:hypothetical protein [Pseudoalteromonas ulvae]OUL59345.1 hypothetical protein B1199_03500 [Pseudoalteromonas ulvae]
MLKIGILVTGSEVDYYLKSLLEQLSEQVECELVFLIQASPKTNVSRLSKLLDVLHRGQIMRVLSGRFFNFFTQLEKRLLQRTYPELAQYEASFDISELITSSLTITPQFSASKWVVRFDDDSIAQLRDQSFDVIMRGNAPGIFRGDILSVAKHGLLSFHHGDNRWNRGGPAGFWEVYQKRSSTGFIVQKLSEELDGGQVLARGNLATARSFTENQIKIFSQSISTFVAVVSDIAKTGQLPSVEPSLPFSHPILTTPKPWQSMWYCLCSISSLIGIHLLQRFLSYQDVWGVAFVRSGWQNAVLSKGAVIENPRGRYLADPFVISHQQQTVCFVEDYDLAERRGAISAVDLSADKPVFLGPIIDEPFHLSFPYIFEYQQQLYMIPESTAANGIRLYHCDSFPMQWQFQYELMPNCEAVDSMVFEYEGRWWLFTNLKVAGGTEHCAQLHAFYSDSPLSTNWTPHQKNPIVFDSDIGRNGGIVSDEHSLYRCRQAQGFNSYGAGLSIAKIITLTPSSYEEQQVSQLSPDFFADLRGNHHLHSNGQYSVFDFLRVKSTWRAGK